MKTILIIDDSPTVFGIIEQIILDNEDLKQNIRIVLAKDGLEGLLKINENNPHLIFLDHEMPYLSGFQILNLIRNNNDYLYVPVVFLGNDNNIFDKSYCMMFGVSDYLAKDILKKEQIINLIQKYIVLDGDN